MPHQVVCLESLQHLGLLRGFEEASKVKAVTGSWRREQGEGGLNIVECEQSKTMFLIMEVYLEVRMQVSN